MATEPEVLSFLEGGAITIAPARVTRTLAELWAPAAEAAAEGDAQPAVTRVSLGTICVLCTAAKESEVGDLLNRLSERHPSRAILVVIDPDAPADISAQVSASCHLAVPGEPQVCSERIRLSCGPDGMERLPGTILPLLEPDVPATLWWDLPTVPPADLCSQLGRVMDRSVTDLTRADDAAAIYRALVESDCEPISDLAWFRARAWREAVARCFDSPSHLTALPAIETIEVVAAATHDGQLLPAALLGGWVAGQLGWTPDAWLDPPERAVAGGCYLVGHTRWRRPNGEPGTVNIATVPLGDGRPGRLQSLILSAPSESARWSFERLHDRPRELRLEAHHELWCQLPARVPAPRPQRLEVLDHTFMSPPRTATRDRALRLAGWILGWVIDGEEVAG